MHGPWDRRFRTGPNRQWIRTTGSDVVSDFWAALALLLVIEGALYALAPLSMKRMMRYVLDAEDSQLRSIGLIAALAGLGLLWLVRG